MSESYFYILKCKDGSLYSGVTSDLATRLKHHNEGKGGKYTRARKPVTLVYTEKFKDLSSARLRENEVKKWRRAKREELIRNSRADMRFPSAVGLGTTSPTSWLGRGSDSDRPLQTLL